MSDSNLRTIEIDGVKLEVDLRTAKRIDTLKVGSRVKVLKKSYDGIKVHHGVVVGFEPFDKLPTIIVAYVVTEYSKSKLDFCYYNNQTAIKGELEIIAAIDDDHLSFDRDEVIKEMDREIGNKEREAQELRDRREYFLKKFNSYWTPVGDPSPFRQTEASGEAPDTIE